MTCRHERGDRSCRTQYPLPPEAPVTPDASKYEVVDALQVGRALVLKVKYPNCYKCSFEGVKVLIFAGCTAMDALKWKRIDPHFRDPKIKVLPSDAPSPVARFPASDAGWAEALAYAQHSYA